MANKAILTGNTGADVEIRTMPNGDIVANFPLATTKRWKNKEGVKQEKTSWHQLSVFGGLAGVCRDFVKKGDKLYIEGEIDYQEYEKDGVKKYSTKIIVKEMEMLGSKSDNAGSGQAPQQSAPPANANFDDGSDIPF